MDTNVMKRLMKELASLSTNPLPGITLVDDQNDMSVVQAIIDGPVDTPYEEGRFRITLKLGNDYPTAPPKGHFVTKIFHPNVSLAGEICVNTLKKDWQPTLGIKDILLTIKCLLIVPNAESALNEEAGKMLLEAYDDYRARAKSWTKIHASGKKDRDAVTAARAALAAATATTATTATASTATAAAAAATSTSTTTTTAAATATATVTSAPTASTTATTAATSSKADESTSVAVALAMPIDESLTTPRGGDKENSDLANNATSASASSGSGSASPPLAKKSKPIVAAKPKVNRRL